MTYAEYLEIPESLDYALNVKTSIVFSDKASINQRALCLPTFLGLIARKELVMTFDGHPYQITRFDVNIGKRTLKIWASLSNEQPD